MGLKTVLFGLVYYKHVAPIGAGRRGPTTKVSGGGGPQRSNLQTASARHHVLRQGGQGVPSPLNDLT